MVQFSKNYQKEELEKASRQKAVLKKYWDQLLGEGADFGFFSNPEIGTVFIVGPLSTMFLHDVDGKKLGAMSEGPYGILRGMGAGKTNVAKYLNKLNDGSYILLVRGPSYELERLKNSLDAMDKAV